MTEYTPFSKINYDLFKQNYNPNLPYNQQSQTIQQKYNEDLFNKYLGIASEEPKLGFIDKFTGGLEKLFSAYGDEKSQVPNLDYLYNVPTFDLATGITNISSASPFLKSISDIAASGTIDKDLVSQLKAEEAAKLAPVKSSVMYDEYPPGISFRPQVLDTSRFTGVDLESGYLDRAGSSDQDVYSEKPKSFRDSKTLEEYSQNRSLSQGLEALLQYLPFGEKSPVTYLLNQFLPKESPEIKSMKNFYRNQYGLDPVGRVASGIMAGYNPVSGGLLNMITGGKYGEPTRFGLANAARQRIENIAKRKAAQTDASRAKIAELQRFAEADTISRARQAASDVYSKAEANKALGPGGGFSTSGSKPGTSLGSGQFKSSSNPRGRKDY